MLAFAAAIASDGEVDDATYRAVREHLDEREVVELALTAGLYLMLARIMTALRIDPDPPFGDLAALPPDLDWSPAWCRDDRRSGGGDVLTVALEEALLGLTVGGIPIGAALFGPDGKLRP